MADGAGITLKDAESALKAALDGIKKALKKNDKVTLVGFGTFSVSKRKARMGRKQSFGASPRWKKRTSPPGFTNRPRKKQGGNTAGFFTAP